MRGKEKYKKGQERESREDAGGEGGKAEEEEATKSYRKEDEVMALMHVLTLCVTVGLRGGRFGKAQVFCDRMSCH